MSIAADSSLCFLQTTKRINNKILLVAKKKCYFCGRIKLNRKIAIKNYARIYI